MLEVAKQVAVFLVAMPMEVLYIVIGMCFAKQIKEKKVLFFFLLLASSIICMLIARWQLWYYISFVALGYLTLRFLYKSHISDLFVFLVFFSIVAITSCLTMSVVGNSILGLIIQRTLMFGTLALRGNFNKWYKVYRELWNRRDDKRIKSITLRNISLIFLNAFIVFMNFFLIFLQNFSK